MDRGVLFTGAATLVFLGLLSVPITSDMTIIAAGLVLMWIGLAVKN